MQLTANHTPARDTTATQIDLNVVRFLIECDEPRITDVLTRVFLSQPASAGSPTLRGRPEHHYRITPFVDSLGQERFSVECDGDLQRASLDLKWSITVMAALMSDQLMEAYTECFRTLHAGAFAKGDCGILVPGESHSGKSTTSAIFALSGFRFYSDDLAILDDQLRLVPHPRAIMLRSGGWARVTKSFGGRAEDRLVWGDNAADTYYVDPFECDHVGEDERHPQIKLILLPTRDAEVPTLMPMKRSEVVPLLVSQCFGMASDPAGSLETIIRLVSGTDCYTINMHDPLKAVDAVNDLVEERTR